MMNMLSYLRESNDRWREVLDMSGIFVSLVVGVVASLIANYIYDRIRRHDS